MRQQFAVGRVQHGRMTTYSMTEKGIVGTSRPTLHAVPPVQPVQSVDIPSFMVRNNPVTKPVVKQGKQSFADILAEAQRIIGN